VNYFSLSSDLIVLDRPLPYDLFINSSSLENRQRFVRIFRKGDPLTRDELKTFVTKYHQLYLAEEERQAFLRTLSVVAGAPVNAKTAVIKDTTIRRLKSLFEGEHSGEALSETLSQSRECVDSMIDVLHDSTVDGLQEMISNLGFHDSYTYDHSINVAMYSILIYKLIDPHASRQMLTQVGLGGLFHDLGKVKLPTSILNNSGALSDAEYAAIRKHPQDGCDMLNDAGSVKVPEGVKLDLLSRVVLEHHENFDGSGYPRKLKGDKIHLLSRVVAIADFFDAVTTKRSYHEPLPVGEALSLMAKSAGSKLDVELFAIFEKYASSAEHHQRVFSETELELPSSFDPCQPQRQLPFMLLPPEEVFADRPEQDEPTLPRNIPMGDEPSEGYGKIRLIESVKPKKRATKKRA
jgi:HD-GYP domain-containing protein (c-di-GMP phosphodiesterase class II)